MDGTACYRAMYISSYIAQHIKVQLSDQTCAAVVYLLCFDDFFGLQTFPLIPFQS